MFKSLAMAANEEVKILGIEGCSFLTRVEIALKLKGVEYEYIQVASLEEKSELLLKYNPIHKKVPVLLHNEKPICESLVILEYVDEAWEGYSILPSDPYQRAEARFWSKFIDDKVWSSLSKAVWNPDEKEREKGIEESKESLQILENEVKEKGKFFNGDSIGFVDITALFLAYWVPISQEAGGPELFNAQKFPNLHKWAQQILNHPIVKQALPPTDPLFAIFKTRFQTFLTSN